MAATQSLQDVAHLLTPALYQDATHFVDAQSVAAMSHTNKSICEAVRGFLLSYKQRVLTAFEAGAGPECQVHVWRTESLKKVHVVEIAGCSCECGNNLVLSTNKTEAIPAPAPHLPLPWPIRIGNWWNAQEPPELVETAEFVRKVYACGSTLDTTAYIFLHGWKTVEHFLLKMNELAANELAANRPDFLQHLTQIPLVVVTKTRRESPREDVEALRAAGFDFKNVWFFIKGSSFKTMRIQMQHWFWRMEWPAGGVR